MGPGRSDSSQLDDEIGTTVVFGQPNSELAIASSSPQQEVVREVGIGWD